MGKEDFLFLVDFFLVVFFLEVFLLRIGFFVGFVD